MKKRNKKPARAITTREAQDIRDCLAESESKYKAERDCMLFNIGIATGYRMQDLVDLKIRDLKIFLDNGYFSIMEKKKVNALKAKLNGQEVGMDEQGEDIFISPDEIINKKVKPREVEIIPELRVLIRSYIEGKKNRSYAFMTTKCKKEELEKGEAINISRESFSKIVKAAGMKACKMNNITGHSLRKCYAKNIYDETNGDIFLVKDMLGHSSIEVTKRYLGLDKIIRSEAQRGLSKLFSRY